MGHLSHAKQPKGTKATKPDYRKAVANIGSFGVTSVHIKVGKHPKRSIRSSPIPYEDMEWMQRNFAKNYGFRKNPTGRSPVSGWEHSHIIEGTHIHPTEKAMAEGRPSGFKCHSKGDHKCGALRLSGHHKAHQVGKRKR